MGFRRYRGPVTTLEEAVMADLPVTVRCLTCRHERSFSAFRLVRQKRSIATVKLREPASGFRCLRCRSTKVVISAPFDWV